MMGAKYDSETQRYDSETWMVAASCLGHPQLFFSPDGSESRSQRNYRESKAKAVCHECVVKTHCLAEAVRSDERFGIWGGLTERERRAMRRTDKERPLPVTANVELSAAAGGGVRRPPNGS